MIRPELTKNLVLLPNAVIHVLVIFSNHLFNAGVEALDLTWSLIIRCKDISSSGNISQ